MISLVELRARLGVQPKDDDELKRLRTDVIALWEARTNRLWNKRTGYEEELELDEDYERKSPLFLTLSPILSVGKLEVWDDGNEANATELDSDDYKISADISKITRLPQTTFWLRNARVTYDGGVDETTTPDDIKEALGLKPCVPNSCTPA